METGKIIVVTGAAGFIGSCLVQKLNSEGYNNIAIVDDFEILKKAPNLSQKNYLLKIERKNFNNWLPLFKNDILFIFHIGARTDTTEFDVSIFDELNLNFSKNVFQFCTQNQIPLLYASSAATYGNGEHGYSDDHAKIEYLKPINPYGNSKHQFDRWVLSQKQAPPFWCGLKFFNIYGPNEYHKGRMASVVFHAYNQILETGLVKLFRSHNPQYKDGHQKRDFVYVKDLLKVCFFFFKNQTGNGIYNLGTGGARTFLDLVNSIFASLNKTPKIDFIDTPLDIRSTYQYFTQAVIDKLRAVGFVDQFTSLEAGVSDYIKNYLSQKKYY